VRLLPYLEGDTVYETVEWSHGGRDNPGSLPDSFLAIGNGVIVFSRPVNETPLTTTIPVFLCPSDIQRPAGNNYRACMGYGPGIFGPNSGAICQYPGNASGAFVNGRPVRPAEFRDGLSNTVLFSEQLIGDGDPQRYTPWTDAFYFEGNLCTADDARQRCAQFATVNAQHDSFRGTTWLLGGWRHTWYNHVLTPNSHVPDCSAGGEGMGGGGNGAYAARSYHEGGVNVVMADGSSRFVSENVNPAIWQALATRSGKESIGDSF
jgi:prepilin-type processing-associated H-X9-DG protein